VAGAAIAWTFAPGRFRRSVTALAALTAVLPDFDLVPFYLGADHGGLWGHRGFTHSLVFAACTAACGAALLLGRRRYLTIEAIRVLSILLAAAVSHPMLDAFTRAGPGVALLAPFDQARYFFPVRRIAGALPRPAALFGHPGLAAFAGEFVWIWIPAILLVTAAELRRRRRSRPGEHDGAPCGIRHSETEQEGRQAAQPPLPASACPATPATDVPSVR
jgi:inner membrane protein